MLIGPHLIRRNSSAYFEAELSGLIALQNNILQLQASCEENGLSATKFHSNETGYFFTKTKWLKLALIAIHQDSFETYYLRNIVANDIVDTFVCTHNNSVLKSYAFNVCAFK